MCAENCKVSLKVQIKTRKPRKARETQFKPNFYFTYLYQKQDKFMQICL